MTDNDALLFLVGWIIGMVIVLVACLLWACVVKLAHKYQDWRELKEPSND